MPSTLTHLALAGAIAAALLGEYFDRRALAVVFVVAAFPDLDAFASMVTTVGHRALLHNVFVVLVPAAVLLGDRALAARYTDYQSPIRDRLGRRGLRIAWVSLACLLFSSIMLDLIAGSANPFWPVHDQYYHVDGKLEYHTQNGWVQTFVDLSPAGEPSNAETVAQGTTDENFLGTAVDPKPGPESLDTNRVLPFFRHGWEVAVFVVGTFVTSARALQERVGAA